MTQIELEKSWKSLLNHSERGYHALRQAVIYAGATGGDPEMIKGWMRVLWNCPDSEMPDLSPEIEMMRKKLAQKR